VPITQKTVSADDELRDCSQMLDQSIEENRALKKENASLTKLHSVDKQIIANKDDTIDQQGKLIAIYEKKKGTTISFFFGFVKIKKN
jgi:regulator of replication initiation timing